MTSSTELSLRRKRWFRALALLLALTLGGIAAELFVRILLPDPRTPGDRYKDILYLPDAELEWVRSRNIAVSIPDECGNLVPFNTDQHGLRYGEAGHDATEGVIAVLGDSFIQAKATPYEQTFCKTLSDRLGGIRVLDIGVDGYSNQQAIILAKRIAPYFEISTAILTVYAGNDLRDNLLWHSRPKGAHGLLRGILKRSAVMRLLYRTVAAQDPVPGTYNWRSYFDAELVLYDSARSKTDLAKFTQARRISLDALLDFKAFCSELKARAIVVFVPTKAMVYEEPSFISGTETRPGSKSAMLHVLENGFDFEYVRETWIELAKQADLPIVDLTQTFRTNKDLRLYGRIDRHWSAEGQRLAADAVTAYLRGE